MMEKIALVSGGSRGIGSQIVKRLHRDGYTVYFTFNKSASCAEELCSSLDQSLRKVIAVKCDVSSSFDVENLMGIISGNGHTVSLLVNNAGIAFQGLFQDTDEKTWDHIFNVNVKGSYLLTRSVLPSMISQKSGNIIIISSMWGQVGASCEVAYSASKSALIGMTKALAKEVGPSGIRVNAIAPGLIDTDMTASVAYSVLCGIVEETPLMRSGQSEDIANAVSFLAGDDSSFITGQILPVNGGLVI